MAHPALPNDRHRGPQDQEHDALGQGTLDKPGTRVAQKSALNRSIADAAWGRFVTYLAYKAERAGGQVIRVKPHNTSNCCSSCELTPSRIGDASFVPIAVTSDRDHNAALNILARGIAAPVTMAA